MITNEITKINNTALLNKVESEYIKEDLPNVRVGDTVRLGVEIREGKKTRTQAYEGVIISQKNSGINKTITVRRVMQGELHGGTEDVPVSFDQVDHDDARVRTLGGDAHDLGVTGTVVFISYPGVLEGLDGLPTRRNGRDGDNLDGSFGYVQVEFLFIPGAAPLRHL